MNIISSKDNELIKNIKKLKEKKYRDINNQYIIEGIKLIKEAINNTTIILFFFIYVSSSYICFTYINLLYTNY